ncbi:hypothetical protein Gpo141_00003394 [Globisporangium polare]
MAGEQPNSDAICALLAQHTPSKTQEEELEYVAELVLDVADEHASADATALAGVLVETLEDASSFLKSDSLPELSAQLVALLRPSEASQDDEKVRRREAHIESLRVQYAVGKRCLAVLEEDDEWHPAVISRQVNPEEENATGAQKAITKRKKQKRGPPFHLEIEFIEFGKKQVMLMEDVVLDEDRADRESELDTSGLCEMCERPMNLTAHHLTPRVTHARYLKQGYTREFLNTCIMICRQCHSKIHSTEDERTLAREFNTLEKIMAHPEIVRWVSYARKQKARIRPVKKSKHPVGK